MPLTSIKEVRARIESEIEGLRIVVLDRPPSDWPGFQKILGQYTALQRLKAELDAPANPEDKK